MIETRLDRREPEGNDWDGPRKVWRRVAGALISAAVILALVVLGVVAWGIV